MLDNLSFRVNSWKFHVQHNIQICRRSVPLGETSHVLKHVQPSAFHKPNLFYCSLCLGNTLLEKYSCSFSKMDLRMFTLRFSFLFALLASSLSRFTCEISTLETGVCFLLLRFNLFCSVAASLSEHKRLHGGLAFVPSLPHTHSAKLKRNECSKLIEELIKSGDCHWVAVICLRTDDVLVIYFIYRYRGRVQRQWREY